MPTQFCCILFLPLNLSVFCYFAFICLWSSPVRGRQHLWFVPTLWLEICNRFVGAGLWKLLSVPVWGTPATSSGPELIGATDRVHLCSHWWDWGKGRAEKALFSTRICTSEIEKPWQDLLEMSCLHVVCSWVKVAGQVKNTSSRDWLQ